MKRTREITGYNLSRDYALLFQLAEFQSIVCIVDYDRFASDGPVRDVCQTICRIRSDGIKEVELVVRGMGYLLEDDLKRFIHACELCNVEFLIPNK